jgi:hypothetical protein
MHDHKHLQTLVSNNIYPAILSIGFKQFNVKIYIWLHNHHPATDWTTQIYSLTL